MATAPFDRSHTSPLAFHSNCPILYHFRDTARLVENRDFLYPPECDDPVQVRRIITRLNIAVRFGMEKLERCGYPMAKKVWDYVYSFRHNTRTWRTRDRRTDTAHNQKPRLGLCVASHGKICAIDLSKAFDKVNHHALYIKLMKRLIPNELLLISTAADTSSLCRFLRDFFNITILLR